MYGQGNTFASVAVGLSHARRVWLEVTEVYNGGGVLGTATAFLTDGKGVVPAGTAVKLSGGVITPYDDAAIQACKDASEVAALGINGYLQSDIHMNGSSDKGTGTVVFHGKLDAKMIKADTLAKLKLNTLTPMITFVE